MSQPDLEHVPDLEHAWRINDYISNYVQLADTKAGAIIALAAIQAGLLALVPDHLSVGEKALLGFASLVVLVGIVLAVASIWPRTNTRPTEGSVFWGNIASHPTPSAYLTRFRASDPLREVVEQNHHLSAIACSKYVWLQRAIRVTAIGVVVFWLAVFAVRLH
ncbi:MAG TPA: Pycsar system effector family protein [Deinococcales bacterium]|nr:Pycsar system effector family protein [Deinococcales bacterium]